MTVITSADVEFSAENQVKTKKKKRSLFDSDFVVFILLSRESDGGAMCRTRGSESRQWAQGKFFGGPPTFRSF